MKEYYIQLQEEYNIPIPEKATDEDISEWAEKTKGQINSLIENYGTLSWTIHRFMELCRAEDISESLFRELVRKEVDKWYKIRTETLNKYGK
jgi:hypothetical protein